MSQKIAIERVDHIGIRVRDLDRALNFYRVQGSICCAGPKATTLRSSETETASN